MKLCHGKDAITWLGGIGGCWEGLRLRFTRAQKEKIKEKQEKDGAGEKRRRRSKSSLSSPSLCMYVCMYVCMCEKERAETGDILSVIILGTESISPEHNLLISYLSIYLSIDLISILK